MFPVLQIKVDDNQLKAIKRNEENSKAVSHSQVTTLAEYLEINLYTTNKTNKKGVRIYLTNVNNEIQQ